MVDVSGVIQQELDDLVASGEEAGLQAAVYMDGELVADCVAGVVAKGSDTPVRSDTLFTIGSATKGVVVTAFHILVSRGLFDYDKPVAYYWPDFAANGKESITISQVLNHTAGIPQTPTVPDTAHHDLWVDTERAIEETAKLEPMFKPGTTSCYHGLTIGWVLDGLVRRVDGRTMGQVVRDEVAVPLGLQDELYLGTPRSAHSRMATVYEPEVDPGDLPEFDLDSIEFKVIPPDDETLGAFVNRPEVRLAEIPAGNISSSARALARVYASVVSEVDGRRLISHDRFNSFFRYRVELPDVFMKTQYDAVTPRMLGYQLSTGSPDQLFYYGPNLRAIGHEGYGGTVGFADPDRQLGFGYTKTLLRPLVKDDETGKLRATQPIEWSKTRITRALFDALKPI